MSYGFIGAKKNLCRQILLVHNRNVLTRFGNTLKLRAHSNSCQALSKTSTNYQLKLFSNKLSWTNRRRKHRGFWQNEEESDTKLDLSKNSELLNCDLLKCSASSKNKCGEEEKPQSFCRSDDHCKPRGPPPTCSKPKDDGNSNFWKILAALLALLGLLGLLLWLLKRSKRNQNSGGGGGLPDHIPYLLVGGGAASISAYRSIKLHNPTAKVLMISNECRKPYLRPPLSKELWYSTHPGDGSNDLHFKQWTGADKSLYFEPDGFFADPNYLDESSSGGLALLEGVAVKQINAEEKFVILSNDHKIGYDECLIATGCSPKNLDVFLSARPGVKDKVMVYRTQNDFIRLKHYAEKKKSITIIGSGFIASELACSLARYGKTNGLQVYQVYEEPGNMSREFPDYLSLWTTKKIEELGVCVIPSASIRKAERDEENLKLHLNNGQILLTDIAVVCVGCDPNTNLATTSCLETHRSLGGFLVNAELEARSHLFVAGDASCFYDPLLGRRRVEHLDHSIVSGRLAGENMLGMKKPYEHQSMFWSDLGPEIGFEGVGLIDSSLKTIGVFALDSGNSGHQRSVDHFDENQYISEHQHELPVHPPSEKTEPLVCPESDEYGRGVIFYLKSNKVVGILLWNLYNRIGLARSILSEKITVEDLDEAAKLFEIHS